jgi:succinate dehydrogenase / fumarate reductase iron-sulfur subunit
MNPLDVADRIPEARNDFGTGYCNITKCCTDLCPEHINITDNGIIPIKERIVGRFYDPIAIIGRKLFGSGKSKPRAKITAKPAG